MRHSSKKQSESTDLYLWGEKAIMEYSRNAPDLIQEITAKTHKDLEPFKSYNCKQDVGPNSLDRISPSKSIKVAAKVHVPLLSASQLKASLKEAPRENETILVLDHIMDPRNYGSILRTAAFFGIEHVIVANRRQAPVSQVVLDTSRGGLSICKLTEVSNIASILEELKELGFWIYGAELGGETLKNAILDNSKKVLVLGSEDKGLSPLVLKKCDYRVRIPGGECSIDSLNVAVSCGVLLHTLSAQ